MTLANIRNYTKRTFSFSPYVTVIIGPNTSGKTNILEAIYAIATGKSFHADQDREMIQWGSGIGRIKADLEDMALELVVTTGSINDTTVPLKKYTVNGVSRRMMDFVGNLRAVLFWPEHLELVTDSPSLRRKYMDMVLVQVDREYRRNLQSYERGLRQRNRLLDLINEGRAVRSQLLFWNQLLIKAGGYLTDKRTELIEFINNWDIRNKEQMIRTKQANVSLFTSHFSLSYDKSVISDTRLEQYADAELAARATLVGPHRDDLTFLIEKNSDKGEGISNKEVAKSKNHSLLTSHFSLSSYGSRGEQRLAILWLKLAEVEYIHEKTGERPMLLLDDIFSELDREHRKLVLDLIGKQQTVITSAEDEIISILPKQLLANTEIIRLTMA